MALNNLTYIKITPLTIISETSDVNKILKMLRLSYRMNPMYLQRKLSDFTRVQKGPVPGTAVPGVYFCPRLVHSEPSLLSSVVSITFSQASHH